MPRKKSIQISIPRPCTQGWDGMEKATGGRYCQACEKTVIDFSQLTDDEILQVFSKAKGNVCGHFRTSQLNREIAPLHTPPRFPFISRIAMAGAVVAGFFNTSAAAKLPEKPTMEWREKGEEGVPLIPETESPKYIRGRVLDSTTNEPISYANILVKGRSIGTVTDTEGAFSIRISDSLWRIGFTIEISFIGYETTEIPIKKNTIPEFLTVKLAEAKIDEYIFGVLVDVNVYKKTLNPWQRFRYWCRRKVHKIF